MNMGEAVKPLDGGSRVFYAFNITAVTKQHLSTFVSKHKVDNTLDYYVRSSLYHVLSKRPLGDAKDSRMFVMLWNISVCCETDLFGQTLSGLITLTHGLLEEIALEFKLPYNIKDDEQNYMTARDGTCSEGSGLQRRV
jgi:hypothetical protein